LFGYIYSNEAFSKRRFQELREELGDVERMLKALIKSLENKHLNP